MERQGFASRGIRTQSARISGRRRRFITALALLAIAAPIVTNVVGSVSAGAAATVDRDLRDYAVFGWNSVGIKGKDGASFFGGHVGVNDVGGTLNICQNGTVKMGPGTQVVGDKLAISSLCDFTQADVFYGTKPPGLGTTIKDHSDAPFTAPINPTNI